MIAYFALGEQSARSVRLVDFAPFLIQEHPNTALLGGDVFGFVEAVEQQVAQVRHVRPTLYTQVGNARTGEDAQRHVQRQLTLRLSPGASSDAAPRDWVANRAGIGYTDNSRVRIGSLSWNGGY